MITGITFCLIVIMANLVVGAFVGLTGVAGFPAADHIYISSGTWHYRRTGLKLWSFYCIRALGSVNYKKDWKSGCGIWA